MQLPNLLDTRLGRLTAFFFLYVTEGIPLGFGAVAIATQLRRADVGPAEIGAFVGSFYLPWAFKWAFGPFIDVFASERLGRRRGWILGTQIMLIVTLLACTGLDLPAQLGLLTGVLLIHNSFGAMQDVAIENKFNYVFDNSSQIILYADESLDVTKLVKAKLGVN